MPLNYLPKRIRDTCLIYLLLSCVFPVYNFLLIFKANSGLHVKFVSNLTIILAEVF